MQTKIRLEIVPHKKDIRIDNRQCNLCGKNCNRAFIIRFRGLLQGDITLCSEEIGKINHLVNSAKSDVLVVIDSFKPALEMGQDVLTIGGKKIV